MIESYDETIFRDNGLNTKWVKQVQTMTHGCGVVRGMHWQTKPHEQVKLVRCISGYVMDVIVDVRPDSKGFGKPIQTELTGDNMNALYVPAGFAHGFQCVSEWCIMLYLLSDIYDLRSARTFYCEDKDVGIKWPLPVMRLSEADATAPILRNANFS